MENLNLVGNYSILKELHGIYDIIYLMVYNKDLSTVNVFHDEAQAELKGTELLTIDERLRLNKELLEDLKAQGYIVQAQMGLFDGRDV